jgi:hemolysin III
MSWLHFREPVSAWTHLLWLALSLPGTWALWRLSRGDRLKQAGLAVFGFGLAACYAGSGLFHAVPEHLSDRFNTLDHIGIHLMIAGTVTPIALVVLRGRWRAGLLVGIWALALAGIALRLCAELPINVLTAIYLGMGWLACSAYFELVRLLPAAKVRWVLLGGFFYSVGALINGLHWPVLVPHVFGWHEIFHLFVMTGSLCHYCFMLRGVVPYQRC